MRAFLQLQAGEDVSAVVDFGFYCLGMEKTTVLRWLLAEDGDDYHNGEQLIAAFRDWRR